MATLNKTGRLIKRCISCSKDFSTTVYLVSIKKGKFCSRKCCDDNKIGKASPFKKDIKVNCIYCTKEFISKVFRIKNGRGKFCSKECTNNAKIGISPWNKGLNIPNKLTGKHWKLSDEAKINIGNAHRGEKNWKWISDRTKLQKYGDANKDRRSYAYNNWRKQVWLRDNFKCKIANPDCNGRLEAHHILGFTEYAELRYNINNGVTLCHFHHPRKRAEEIKMSSFFQQLLLN